MSPNQEQNISKSSRIDLEYSIKNFFVSLFARVKQRRNLTERSRKIHKWILYQPIFLNNQKDFVEKSFWSPKLRRKLVGCHNRHIKSWNFMQTLDLRPLETLSFEPGIYRKTFFSTILTSLDVENFETRSRDVIVYTEITPKVYRFKSILNNKKYISQNWKVWSDMDIREFFFFKAS